ncbi:hypothetical protein C5167_050118 [Papaver somniferum]|uniref:Uncharacterized protein n=1 Tax=Papaver somniferum TaxID=3469 RepID=A0A4Y7KRN8_PAPSO|nr:WD repeat-containing protein DDB_G0290555-like [Papaver somniferum]RZC74639.1 hypothetical protein C5167_050118 [Papaver somniferum]
MPRTTTLELPGCPPIRALTFDILGLIKVIESRSAVTDANKPQVVTAAANITPKVVETWGAPDKSRCILNVSINDRKSDPLLAVARKNGQIEVLNPLNGEIRASETLEDSSDNPISGLHLFRKENSVLSSRSCSLLTCTEKGNAILRSLEIGGSLADSSDGSRKTWDVCSSGNIFCSAVDGNEKYAVFGGKGVEINVWDLESCTKTWNAKSPKKDSLDIFTPTWFTAATFLSKDDHRKIVTGTNSHQVRLYDISAQRRPVISFDFRETAIKSVTEDLDGHTIYFGTGGGDLASVDMRTGKVLGCFIGKCSGSIRSIVRHPEFPMIASCGLDRYLRFWDIKTRQPLSAVFLKQHLTKVVFDSNFCDKETVTAAIGQGEKVQEKEEDDEDVSVRRKKSSRENDQEMQLRLKKKPVQQEVDSNDDDEQEKQLKPKKKKKPVQQEVDSNDDDEQEKQLKPKKKKKSVQQVVDDDEDDDQEKQMSENDEDASLPVKRKNASSEESEQKKKLKAKKKKKRVQQEEDDH